MWMYKKILACHDNHSLPFRLIKLLKQFDSDVANSRITNSLDLLRTKIDSSFYSGPTEWFESFGLADRKSFFMYVYKQQEFEFVHVIAREMDWRIDLKDEFFRELNQLKWHCDNVEIDDSFKNLFNAEVVRWACKQNGNIFKLDQYGATYLFSDTPFDSGAYKVVCPCILVTKNGYEQKVLKLGRQDSSIDLFEFLAESQRIQRFQDYDQIVGWWGPDDRSELSSFFIEDRLAPADQLMTKDLLFNIVQSVKDYIHKGMIHSDFKGGNILVNSENMSFYFVDSPSPFISGWLRGGTYPTVKVGMSRFNKEVSVTDDDIRRCDIVALGIMWLKFVTGLDMNLNVPLEEEGGWIDLREDTQSRFLLTYMNFLEVGYYFTKRNQSQAYLFMAIFSNELNDLYQFLESFYQHQFSNFSNQIWADARQVEFQSGRQLIDLMVNQINTNHDILFQVTDHWQRCLIANVDFNYRGIFAMGLDWIRTNYLNNSNNLNNTKKMELLIKNIYQKNDKYNLYVFLTFIFSHSQKFDQRVFFKFFLPEVVSMLDSSFLSTNQQEPNMYKRELYLKFLDAKGSDVTAFSDVSSIIQEVSYGIDGHDESGGVGS